LAAGGEGVVSARRLLGLAGALLALVLAAFLAVLAADVLRWRGELEAADVRRLDEPANTWLWVPDTRLPSDPAERLLGLGDDVAVRRALQRFRLSRPDQPARDQHDLAVRAQTDSELARLLEGDPRPAVQSKAAMLRGILALEEARAADQIQAPVSLRRALTELRRAISLDDANEDAKYDLELVLRLIRATEEPNPDEEQGRDRRRGRSQGSGAGSNQNGSGF
jgi:hypothetical protein